MKGYIIHCLAVDNASIGLKAINGFIMKEKPVIISYGHENKTKVFISHVCANMYH